MITTINRSHKPITRHNILTNSPLVQSTRPFEPTISRIPQSLSIFSFRSLIFLVFLLSCVLPITIQATSLLLPYPSTLPTTLTQLFHFRYECPAEGCTVGDKIGMSLVLGDMTYQDSFILSLAGLRWIDLSSPNTILTTTNTGIVEFNNLNTINSIELGLDYPSGSVLIGEIWISFQKISSITHFFSTQPQFQLSIINSISTNTETFIVPISYYLPLGNSIRTTTTTTTTTATKSTPAPLTPRIQFTYVTPLATTIPTNQANVPISQLNFDQFTITLPKISTLQPLSIQIFPMFGLVYVPSTSSTTTTTISNPETCLINSILYQVEIKINTIGEKYFEITNLQLSTLSSWTIQCFITMTLVNQNDINTIYPSKGNNFGLVIALYPTTNPNSSLPPPLTAPPSTSTKQILTHWFHSYTMIPSNPINNIPPTPQFDLNLPNDEINIILYPSFFPQNVPSLQIIHLYIDPPELITFNTNTTEITQYDEVNNFAPSTSLSSSSSPLENSNPDLIHANMIHSAYIFRFNTNNQYPAALNATMLKSLSFSLGLDWDSITTTPTTELPLVQKYPNLVVYKVSWLLYATIVYQVSINGQPTQLLSTDIPINTNFVIMGNATTSKTVPNTNSNWQSDIFSIFAQELSDGAGNELFHIPTKITSSEEFILFSTTFKLGIDITYLDPILKNNNNMSGSSSSSSSDDYEILSPLQRTTSTTTSMNSFNPTLTLGMSYDINRLDLLQTLPKSITTTTSSIPKDLLFQTTILPVAILTPLLPESPRSTMSLGQSTNLQADPTATLPVITTTPTTSTPPTQPNWSNAVFNATMTLYPHAPPNEIEYDPAHFASHLRPVEIKEVTTQQELKEEQLSDEIFLFEDDFISTQSPQTFTSQQIIDEGTPIPAFKQYTFKLTFYSNQPQLHSITFTIQSGQFAFFGNFNESTCLLNGHPVKSFVDYVDNGPKDNIDGYYTTQQNQQQNIQPNPLPSSNLDDNLLLVNPNMYQSITLIIPPEIVDLTKPDLPEISRVGLDGKIEYNDYGPNPPNLLKCLGHTGTIVDISSLYQYVYNDDGKVFDDESEWLGDINVPSTPIFTTMNDNNNKNNINQHDNIHDNRLVENNNQDDGSLIEFESQVPIVKLPHFNHKIDYLQQIPIIMIAHPPSTTSSSTKTTTTTTTTPTELTYPTPLYQLSYSYTAFSTIPPQPNWSGMSSKRTMIIITVVLIIALLALASIPSIRFVMKNFC